MRTPAALLSVALVGLLLAACGGSVAPSSSPSPGSTAPSSPPAASPPVASPESPPEPSASAAAVADDVLFTVGFRGGHCRTGPCDRTIAVDDDGNATLVLPERAALGTIPPALFQAVLQQLSLADFEQLGSRPFTGECPVNFDGQELIYTFYAATGEIRLASCEVELDPQHPLFMAIEAALAAVPVP